MHITEGLTPKACRRRMYRDNQQAVQKLGVTLPPFEEVWARGILDLGLHDEVRY